ncbi:uncharacterized protein B4U79_02516 [Dinothrombium tinctorium]|uniref:Uncharacterized protein n=1 Tax=Dinothrombium tinctorium TaxID=1965070 RepID=A0A3S3PEG4_9ACAR|nr:uncharacterized protein B4U79_02516 [Dinothrombium tinctorium]
MDPFIEESIRKRQKQSLLKRIIAKWPLQRYLGVYAFLPLFVAFGASLEFLMINWTGDRETTEVSVMPYGISWTSYITRLSAIILSMFAGAQLVHQFYQPLSDLDSLVEEAKKRRLSEQTDIEIIAKEVVENSYKRRKQ